MFWPPYATQGGTIGTAPAHWLVEVYNESSEWVHPPRSVTALVPIAPLGRCRGGGEGVEAETHGLLVLLRAFNDLIMSGGATATPRFPKGFQGFRVGDLDTFKMEQEFPLF